MSAIPTKADDVRAPRQISRWLPQLVLVVACAVAWGRTITSPLVRSWDDGHFLDPDANPTLRPSLDALVSAWSEIHFDAYQPLHLMSYWIDTPWLGATGPVVHATHVVLWCGVVLLFQRALERLGLSRASATVAALVFAVHPSAMEIVGWGTGRKDLVALLFSMGALHLHLDAKGPWDRAAWIGRVLFACAMLSKTASVPLPVVLFALDLWCGRRSLRDAAIQQLPALVIALGLGALVLWIWHSHDMIRGLGSDHTAASLTLVPATITHYLAVATFPDSLTPMYAFERDDPSPTWAVWLGPALFVVGLALAWRVRTKSPTHALLGVGLIVALLYLAPVSNAVPLYFQWADRYLVWMSIGLVITLGAALDLVFSGDDAWRRIAVVGAVLAVPLTARSIQYAEVWSGDLRLWGHAVHVEPRSYYAWLKLGEVRRDSRQYGPALDAYAEAIEIAPDLRVGHAAFVYTLGLRDERRADLAPSHALEHSERFLRSMDDAQGLRDLASEMSDQGYRDAMMYVLGRSLDLEPVRDDQLEHAIAVQLENGNLSLARFYLSRMQSRPLSAVVNAFWRRETEAHERSHARRERGDDL
ncbi:MAG: tetratricopeptide repeat protein [Deltaproteobacteria bacterium]|nr:tetratricopeptide repeat protein [Deltaproteobacteria bacterium]